MDRRGGGSPKSAAFPLMRFLRRLFFLPLILLPGRLPAADYGTADVRPELSVPAGTKPLFDEWMRDTYATRGPDGAWYLTGTTAAPNRAWEEGKVHCWDWNDGIRLWRSPDGARWEPLGLIWKLDDAPWQSKFAERAPERSPLGFRLDARRRAVWAPEIHYLHSARNWFLVACMNDQAPQKGSFVLRSTSGKPEGPYENIPGNADGPIFPNIDGSLFEDDDGTVYFIGHNHFFARMKPDMSGLAEPFRRFAETPYPKEPYIEGAFVFKHDGKYHLVGAVWSFRMPDGSFSYEADSEKRGGVRYSYDCVIASADRIEGPYGPRYTAGVGIGHNNLFAAADGRWFATCFGNPRGTKAFTQPFLCRPAVVPMEYRNGKFTVKPAGAP